jgi:hypothetical protein
MKKDKTIYKIVGYSIAVSLTIAFLFGSVWLAVKAISAFVNLF